MQDKTNPYADIAGAMESLARQMGGNEWEQESKYERAERLLTSEDKEQLRKARLLAELSVEYLHRITLGSSTSST